MAYREEIAWLTLATMLAAYGWYFGVAGPAAGFGQERLLDIVYSFGPVAVVHALVMLGGTAAVALASRGESAAPADERDRAVDRRGSAAGYVLLLMGMVWVGVVSPFFEPPWRIVNSALFVIVAAETLRYVLILAAYRRGHA